MIGYWKEIRAGECILGWLLDLESLDSWEYIREPVFGFLDQGGF